MIYYFCGIGNNSEKHSTMKKHFWMALALFMSVGTADVSAQSFLKKLKQKVEAEVENRVTNEATKQVEKVVAKVG